MQIEERYLSNHEYEELQDKMNNLIQQVKIEFVILNEFHNKLRSAYLQILGVEMQLIEMNNSLIGLLDIIDTTAMESYYSDLHFDYLTGNI